MIEQIGRAVAQRVAFQSHTAYRPVQAPRAARAVFHEADLTNRGIYQTVSDMELQPGEVIAVWEVSPSDGRAMSLVAQDLPPRPSKLMMKGADGKMLELNPSYIDINNRPEGYRPITAEERAAYNM